MLYCKNAAVLFRMQLFMYPSTDTEKASEIGESFDDEQHILRMFFTMMYVV